MLVGNISQDNLISAPACNVWEIYRGPNLGRFINKHLSHVIGTVEFIKGDGGPGSVLRLTSTPGTPGIGYEVGRLTIMDDEKHIDELKELEGGHLALGFTCFVARLEIFEKSSRLSIVKSTFEYEIPEKLAEKVSLLSFERENIIAEAVEKHLDASKSCDQI